LSPGSVTQITPVDINGITRILPPRKNRINDVGRPMFIVRKFDSNTDRYIRQYMYGNTWDVFDKHVVGWDANNKMCVEEYNQ
jgi:hypothetical protein